MRRVHIALGVALAAAVGLGTAAAQDLSDERRLLTFVGFQQYKEASRVFIRTNEQVKYRVDDSRLESIVLILENTGASAVNHLNFLDTRYFDSPVRYIQPRLIEGTSPSIRIEIRLSERVPYETLQNDNFLALDFKRR